MTNLKKISLTVVAALALGSSSLVAKSIKTKSFHIGVSQMEIMNESAVGYTIGYGGSATYKNGFYWGTTFDMDITKIKKENVYAYGANIKLGYSPVSGLAIYGMGIATMQSIGNGSGGGFGYGGGVEYRAFKHLAISAEYKTSSMNFEGVLDYDYTIAGANLKYLF